ncbi:MAG: hypothetical protein K5656_09010 [Lachnospiraceae bacterium]|nr:hypothetical protein [Lachnospiraceae bacterium]
MKIEHAREFINQFEKFYFDDSDLKDDDFKSVGLPKTLNRTNRKLEEYIVENKLQEGIFDEEAFAWKAGKAGWDKGFVYAKPLPKKWVNGNGGSIKQNKKQNKDSETFTEERFKTYVRDNKVEIDELNLKSPEDRKKLFIEIKDKYDLDNYGTVYIINHMFFLSQGAVPIYDYYAHVAVKALFMNKSPLEVYVGAPGKNDHPKGGKGLEKDKKEKIKNEYLAVNTLEEYMWLLNEVFPNEIHENGNVMYISRQLDRALWVYGHATKRWPC